MGKIVIDSQMVGLQLPQVIMREALSLAKEKKLDVKKIQEDLENAPNQESFMQIIEEKFGDELIILF